MYVDKASGKYRDITLMPDQDYHWLMSALRHGGEPLTMRIRKKVSPQGAYEDLVLMVHSVQRTTPPPGSSNADQECYLVKQLQVLHFLHMMATLIR